MKDNFYTIWFGIMAVVAVVFLLVLAHKAWDCHEQGGRLMRGLFTGYECILT